MRKGGCARLFRIDPGVGARCVHSFRGPLQAMVSLRAHRGRNYPLEAGRDLEADAPGAACKTENGCEKGLFLNDRVLKHDNHGIREEQACWYCARSDLVRCA